MDNNFETMSVPEKYLQLRELRDRTYEEMDKHAKQRIAKDPMPSDEEILLGSYLEDLEPSIKDAIIGFNKKGYRTQSSGFGGGEYFELQQMDGPFKIDQETEEKLKSIGVSVRRNDEAGLTYIEFEPESADLDVIKKKWDEVTELLPDLQKPNITPGGPWLSERWLDDEKIQKLCLERRLALGAYDNEEDKQAMESRLAQLVSKAI